MRHNTTRSHLLLLILMILMSFLCPTAAMAQRQIALVIGNADYKDAPLRNPLNDARDMAQALRDLRFEVIEVRNATRRAMIEAVDTFGARLQQAHVGLFYYSGHGTQYHGNNYLIPLQAMIEAPADLEHEAVDARRILGRMEQSQTALNLVILDACRNNPFRNLLGFRSFGERGLAPLPRVRSSLIAYATQPDNVAEDGTGRNGTYTKHLLQYLKQPGLSLPDLFSEVGRAVLQETNGKQEPWVSFSPLPRFCLAGCAPSSLPSSPPQATGTQGTPPQASAGTPTTPTPPQPSQGTQVAVGIYPQPPAVPQTLRNSIDMELVLIQSGTFQMGSNDGADDEKPVHTVRISRPFYLGKYEVTQAQWEAVMGNNPSKFKGDSNRPVESVSWDDVQEFIRRLHAKEGGSRYRLPTEAEWEYAARAESTTAYSFGDSMSQLGQYAWYGENAGDTTYPVGRLQPNALGLYDMHGNVWEWVQNWHGAYASGPVIDPTDPQSGSSRVRRGGGWSSHARNCRSAKRGHGAPGLRSDGLGFRLLREAP